MDDCFSKRSSCTPDAATGSVSCAGAGVCVGPGCGLSARRSQSSPTAAASTRTPRIAAMTARTRFPFRFMGDQYTPESTFSILPTKSATFQLPSLWRFTW